MAFHELEARLSVEPLHDHRGAPLEHDHDVGDQRRGVIKRGGRREKYRACIKAEVLLDELLAGLHIGDRPAWEPLGIHSFGKPGRAGRIHHQCSGALVRQGRGSLVGERFLP